MTDRPAPKFADPKAVSDEMVQIANAAYFPHVGVSSQIEAMRAAIAAVLGRASP